MFLLMETSDGKTTTHITESDAIERYLCREFGPMGRKPLRKCWVYTLASNCPALILQILWKNAMAEDFKEKAANKASLIKGRIFPCGHHEEHLQDKGANGHYVGNGVSWADV